MIIRSFLICISLCVTFLTEAQEGVSAAQAVTAAVRVEPAAGAVRSMAGPAADSSGLPVADSLYRAGRFFEASVAYERVLFGNDNADQGRWLYLAVMGKTRCLKKQEQFDQAVTFLEAWQAYSFPDSCLEKIHREQVLCTYLGAHFENTISLVDRWPYLHGGKAPEPLIAILKILALNELQRWPEAAEAYRAFLAARPGSGGQPAAAVLPDLYQQLPHLKNVSKAQLLSYLIPGGGQFYAGRIGEGILSAIVQGAGIWFAVVSFQQHYYVSAWLVGAALFGAFRMGSAKRAEILVNQYNRKQVLKFNAKVREQLLNTVQ